MPAGDEEGICSAHTMSITRKSTTCRDNFSFRSNSLSRLPGSGGALDAHGWWQPWAGRRYSVHGVPFSKVLVSLVRSALVRSGQPGPGLTGTGQPWRTQLSERRSRGGTGSAESGRCWQSHQVPPGQSWWCWRRQDGQTIYLLWPAAASATAGHNVQCQLNLGQLIRAGWSGPAGPYQPDQAAFARRIRRRRSEARSSSFRPPQVPYFSGREIA